MEKIRIRLKSFDHRLLDQSVKDIVVKAKRTGARSRARFPCRPGSTASASFVPPCGQESPANISRCASTSG